MSLCRSESYDLVIVGAGMVGASLACILNHSVQSKPISILLVESAAIDLQAPPTQPSFDARSTVLSHGTVEYLKALSLWDELAPHAELIKKIQVSDQGKFGAVRIASKELGVTALGYVIENRYLGEMFNQALSVMTNLELCSAVSVTAIKPFAGGMQVRIEDGDQCSNVNTELVVMAEGGRSGLCEKIGIHRHSESYQQKAVIGNVAFTTPHENVAFERFTPNGPLALLPLPEHEGQHRAALVWTRADESANDLLELADEDFLLLLKQEFGDQLGDFTRVGQRNSYPLSLVKAEEQVRPGLVLLGNVAHSLHPVAGQGFNLAFRDTMHLASLLLSAKEKDERLGHISLLHQYCAATSSDQELTSAFSHYMTRLFSTDNMAAVWVRKFGLFSIDLVLPLRKAFARRAMGIADRKVNLKVNL